MVAFVSVVIFGPYHSVNTVSTTSSPSTTSTNTLATLPETYTVNGLTCPFVPGTSQNLMAMVRNITRDWRFVTATSGDQFLFGGGENTTGTQWVYGNRTFAGTAIHFPPTLQLIFEKAQPGPAACERSSSQSETIVVDVPIPNGRYDMAAAEISRPGGQLPSNFPMCLEEVPNSTSITQFRNSTFQGYQAIFANGTRDYFPQDSCPVLVPPVLYNLTLTIESNPSFITAEGGGAYRLQPTPTIISNATGKFEAVSFSLFSGWTIHPCGNGTSPWAFEEVFELVLVLPVDSATGNPVPFWMGIQTIPESTINENLCAMGTLPSQQP